jgi:hypothetical protein
LNGASLHSAEAGSPLCCLPRRQSAAVPSAEAVCCGLPAGSPNRQAAQAVRGLPSLPRPVKHRGATRWCSLAPCLGHTGSVLDKNTGRTMLLGHSYDLFLSLGGYISSGFEPYFTSFRTSFMSLLLESFSISISIQSLATWLQQAVLAPRRD